MSWALVLRPLSGDRSRLHLRLRLAGVRHRRLAGTAGGFVDWLTIVLLGAGLRERVGTPGHDGTGRAMTDDDGQRRDGS